MPILIYTIGDYFAMKRKDFYMVTFKNADQANWRNLPEREMIWNWFKENLPNTTIFPVAEYAQPGLLRGEYRGAIGIEFDDKSFAKFVERWEDGNDQSIDPRFQCYFLSLEDYIRQMGKDILDFDYDNI